MEIALRFCVKKQGSAAASIQTDTGSTSVTGDALFVAWSDPNTTGSVGDTINGGASGNTWTRVGTALTAGSVVLNVFRCDNANGGTNHRVTVTFSAGTADTDVYFGAISGAATSAFDQTAQGTDNTTPFQLTTPTLSQANELAVCLASDQGGISNYAEGSGFTVQQQENNDSLYWTSAIATKITSATTALTTSWTITGTLGFTMGQVIATFKESGGGGGAAKRHKLMGMGVGR